MKILEPSGIDFPFEGKMTGYKNSFHVSCRQSTAQTLGGLFCSFSTVQKLCRFYNVSKDELKEHSNKSR